MVQYYTNSIQNLLSFHNRKATDSDNARIFRESKMDFRFLGPDERLMLDAVLQDFALSLKDVRTA